MRVSISTNRSTWVGNRFAFSVHAMFVLEFPPKLSTVCFIRSSRMSLLQSRQNKITQNSAQMPYQEHLSLMMISREPAFRPEPSSRTVRATLNRIRLSLLNLSIFDRNLFSSFLVMPVLFRICRLFLKAFFFVFKSPIFCLKACRFFSFLR